MKYKYDISVIIPCRNEENYIKNTAERILSQEGIEGLFSCEVLFIEGKSTDDTLNILHSLTSEHDNVNVLVNEKQITPCAFNIGIENANGEFICILGAHAEIEPDYLKQCLSEMRSHDAVNVGGPWKAKGHSPVGEAIALAFQCSFVMGNAKSHQVDYEGYIDSVWGGFYKSEIFKEIGLFDEELVRNQDDELNYRITKAGHKIWQSPKIRYFYICRDEISKVFWQYYQYGYWKVRVIQKHKIPTSIRHLIPGLFVLSILLLSSLSIFFDSALYAFLGVVLSYSCYLGLAITSIIKDNDRAKYIPILVKIIGAYHFGYGLGFLKGILDFGIFSNAKKTDIKENKLTR